MNKAILTRILEAMPLPVFLLTMTVLNPATPQEWLVPFAICASLGLFATLLIAASDKFSLNRIYLGLTLYFVSGSLALVCGWGWVNVFYARAGATAMLYCILLVGIYASLASPTGFAGQEQSAGRRVHYASATLLAINILAIAVSWRFHEESLLAAYLPFTSLFVCHSLMRKWLQPH